MRVPCAVTAAGVCCLILFLIVSQTAEGSESNLGHERNTASSSHTSQQEAFIAEVDDDGVDDDDGIKEFGFMDEDDGDDGTENLALTDEYDDDDDDSYDRAYAFLSEGDDETIEEDGAIQEDGEPSKEYMKELLKDEKKEDKKKKNGAAQAYVSRPRMAGLRISHIYHGTRIALQIKMHSYLWMDCATRNDHRCVWSSCPNLFFESSDTRRCYSLLFRIYRHRGRGALRNGDIVALHNPQRNQWLGCWARECRRSSCPGNVNYTYGFQNREKWFRCYGEVFRIYARGRRFGAYIMSHDQVALYYLQGGSWLYAHGHFYKNTCMGSHRPPNDSKFESCLHSTFEINKP